MKVLILGSGKSYGMESSFCRAFKRLNATCEVFASSDKFWTAYNKNLGNKVLTRLGSKKIYSSVQKDILDKVSQFTPDVVLVFKGMEILPSTIKKLREQQYVVINFNPDDPFEFESYASGNKNITESHSLYNAHFCYKRANVQKFIKTGIPSFWLPFAYDNLLFHAKNVTKTQEITESCFIGNPDKKRVRIVNHIAQTIGSIKVYGIGWDQEALNPNVVNGGLVLDEAYHKSISTYRSQLNVFRNHNTDSTNMRVFEIWGNYGLGVHPVSKELKDLDAPDLPFCYSDMDSLCDQIEKQLSLTFEKAREIRERNHDFCMQNHTYVHRVQTILTTLQEKNWI